MNNSRKSLSVTKGVLTTMLAITLAPTFVMAVPTTTNPAVQPVSATVLLQSTMARYAALNTFRAHALWQFSATSNGKVETQSSTRTLVYAKPNKFRVVSASPRLTLATVSDGKKMVQYTTPSLSPAQQDVAPTSITTSKAMNLNHFMFGGTPLLQFFGGSGAQSKLVAAGSTVTNKPDTIVGETPCRVIGFAAVGSFGNTEVAIGKADGLVHRISYDIAPLAASMKEQIGTLQAVKVTETYDVLQSNAKVTTADFSTTLPAGTKAAPIAPAPKEPGSPVPLGQMAPDFSITPIGATEPVKLSSLKGQVVLLDFWATWCPPCRKSLPETNRLNATYGDKGLKVLAISDEKPDTIKPFIEKNKYTFPVYVDAQGEANKVYGIQAIPTFAIIDKEGKLSAFFVGLPEDGAIEAALKKAGLGTP